MKEIVKAAFAADSLCLGAHWIYDIEKIQSLYPTDPVPLDAPNSPYHKDKQKGDLTHYGDQSLVLLEHLASARSWERGSWLDSWQGFWLSAPSSYLDSATRDTLSNLSQGSPRPSNSHDLSAVSRMAPLLALLWNEPVEKAAEAAREQAASTHGDPTVADSAEFATRWIWALRSGTETESAIRSALEQGSYQPRFQELLNPSLETAPRSQAEAARHFGQSCSAEDALPLTIWLALAMDERPAELLQANARLGGDSAARGMILGMVLAAKGQYPRLPEAWTSGLNALARIDAALAALER